MGNKTNGNKDCWPTRQQELLLKASLLRCKGVISAWEEWKSGADIEQLDPGSYNLLPLLYDNLNTIGIKDPLMRKLKGVYRQTWYKNQLSIHRVGVLLSAFHCAGIRTMVLKGAALVLLYYRNYGLRPMGDIDILVHTEQSREAIDFLIKSGWIPHSGSPERLIPLSHGAAFRNPATGQDVDLH